MRTSRPEPDLFAGPSAPAVGLTWPVLQAISSPKSDASTYADPRSLAGARTRFQAEIMPQLDAAYNLARYLARDPDGAQDIVQEACLRAYRGFDGFRGGEARAWLLAIVRNCYHDWLVEQRRRRNREFGLDDDADGRAASGSLDVASDEDTPEDALIRKSEATTVRRVLDGLHRPLREMLVLRELEQLSYREIAQATGLPIGTVMSRIARARRVFGEAWQAVGKVAP